MRTATWSACSCTTDPRFAPDRTARRAGRRCTTLVLTRKLGEKIQIGPNIMITVVDIDRGKIRLGIECPRDIPVYRHELAPQEPPTPAPGEGA
jgi:carbon storage regulator